MVVVDKDACTGCEMCVDVCPAQAISMVNGVAQIDQDECTECCSCVDECPADAIREE